MGPTTGATTDAGPLQGIEPAITNGEFLAGLCPDLDPTETFWVCAFPGDPNTKEARWHGGPVTATSGHPGRPSANCYFACATIKRREGAGRRKEHFGRMFVVPLDDVAGELPVLPTYVIQTSPKKYQAGFRLAEPIVDAQLADRLMQAMVRSGRVDVDRGGCNVARYIRLPVGCNTKRSHVEANGGKPFLHRLTEWHPERAYTVEQLAQWFGLDLTPPRPSPKAEPRPGGDRRHALLLGLLHTGGLYKGDLGDGRHDITCPWVNEHTDSIDNGAAYFEPSTEHPEGGFKCLHSHCADRHLSDLRRQLGPGIYWGAEGPDGPGRPDSSDDREGTRALDIPHAREPGEDDDLGGSRGVLSNDDVDAVAWDEPSTTARPSPVFDRGALYGIAGEYVQAVEQRTEAHPAGILVHFLARTGAAVGRGPHWTVNATEHHARVWPCLVGRTALARKGTASDLGNLPFRGRDRALATAAGLSSGEGLIYAVRGPEDVLSSEVPDELRRLFIEEPEFANVLAQTERQGNTLSQKLRAAWDGKQLSTMTKCALVVTNAHIVAVAHITKDELRRRLNAAELANGFANRFLWIYVERTRLLPRPPPLPEEDIRDLGERLGRLIDAGRGWHRFERTPAADVLWDEEYGAISVDRGGILAQITVRSTAQVMRLAMIYALLDGRDRIDVPHLRAALALWRYSEATCEWVWGEMSGDPIADKILQALREHPRHELTRSEVRDLFKRNARADQLQAALDLLLARQPPVVRRGMRRTGGRTAEVFGLIQPGTTQGAA